MSIDSYLKKVLNEENGETAERFDHDDIEEFKEWLKEQHAIGRNKVFFDGEATIAYSGTIEQAIEDAGADEPRAKDWILDSTDYDTQVEWFKSFLPTFEEEI
jgi:hypothetical protein